MYTIYFDKGRRFRTCVKADFLRTLEAIMNEGHVISSVQ